MTLLVHFTSKSYHINVNEDHNCCTKETSINVNDSSVVANIVVMDQEISDSNTSWQVALTRKKKRGKDLRNEYTFK